jgi:hypothetical protein
MNKIELLSLETLKNYFPLLADNQNPFQTLPENDLSVENQEKLDAFILHTNKLFADILNICENNSWRKEDAILKKIHIYYLQLGELQGADKSTWDAKLNLNARFSIYYTIGTVVLTALSIKLGVYLLGNLFPLTFPWIMLPSPEGGTYFSLCSLQIMLSWIGGILGTVAALYAANTLKPSLHEWYNRENFNLMHDNLFFKQAGAETLNLVQTMKETVENPTASVKAIN